MKDITKYVNASMKKTWSLSKQIIQIACHICFYSTSFGKNVPSLSIGSLLATTQNTLLSPADLLSLHIQRLINNPCTPANAVNFSSFPTAALDRLVDKRPLIIAKECPKTR